MEESVKVLDFSVTVDFGVNVHFEFAQQEIEVGKVEIGKIHPKGGGRIMGQIPFYQDSVKGLG